mmetsp:Transcript_1499/g.3291  ORF Transcript_1499/g.3291 Transcript_1499/m.3291 type:complete len:424 (+) Transcript_1499:234-1505(+)
MGIDAKAKGDASIDGVERGDAVLEVSGMPASEGNGPAGQSAHAEDPSEVKKKGLSWVDKLLTLWIILACALGIGLSQIPAVRTGLEKTSIGPEKSTNILIAVGLILMMYPPLAKVHYNWIPRILVKMKIMSLSVVQNWVIGPILMFFLAYGFLHKQPEYLQGVILIGCARCIAMVIVWNQFAKGCSELCATLVALNSILTIVLYAPYAYALINKLLPALGVPVSSDIYVSFLAVLQSVAIYLGIPFALGLLSWFILRRIKGDEWYYKKFCPVISPITLIALLFTIVMMFALEGYAILQRPLDIVLVAAPLLIYFIIMFLSSFFTGYFLTMSYEECTTIAFTAASNNFELALAIAVSVFGFKSKGAFATIIGPLIEIPVMLALVWVSLLFKKVLWKSDKPEPALHADALPGEAKKEAASADAAP